jgi:hypothetical protein
VVTTPQVNNGAVFAFARVGKWIVVGGSFTQVTQAGSQTVLVRRHVFAFDPRTGAIDTGFAPRVNGPVKTLARGPVPNSVYVGGKFSTVNGKASKSLDLLNLDNGRRVSGFAAPRMNGVVYDIKRAGGRLWIVGSFTELDGITHKGIATLDPRSGAPQRYVRVRLTGHHNYRGGRGAEGAVGGRALAISPDGKRVVVIGDFRFANRHLHDQISVLNVGRFAAVLDSNWNTQAFTARCNARAYDSYVRAVSFSPDGSYFAIANTGGGGVSYNTDRSRSLCDSVSRWPANRSGTNVRPTWVDYSGNDSFWSVAVTSAAIYAGGHARWMNNPYGVDAAGPGAVPRPGIVALDPLTGLPFRWNPGRNPRGVGAFALLATTQGLFVGSDTDWIGNGRTTPKDSPVIPTYYLPKLAYFPAAGGETPPSTTTATLPANVYQAGPMPDGSELTYRSMSASGAGSTTTPVNSAVDWSTTRGAFVVGNSLFWDGTDGNFYRAHFTGSTVGSPRTVDPYDDPAWSDVATGSGQTYRGVPAGYYNEMPSITGQFYADGRIYYTRTGDQHLYWRYFEPDDGIVGAVQHTTKTNVDFTNVEGMFRSGDTIYCADGSDGKLHAYPFIDNRPELANAKVYPGSDDWRARSLFLYGTTS